MKKIGKAAGFLLTALLATGAFAGPAQFGSNSYEFIQIKNPLFQSDIYWSVANDAASARLFNGVSGHLATITSQAENDFLVGLATGMFTGWSGAWIGGKSPEGWKAGPESGQAFTYTNWWGPAQGGVEPNDAGYAYLDVGSGVQQGYWGVSIHPPTTA